MKLTYPSAPQGTYANIAKVKVELPKQLPSRLTTLQKACTAAQFEANPAGCPAASVIGNAKAVMPNMPDPLEGPVYFVSHGGEAFPSLEIVLQGYGVKIDPRGHDVHQQSRGHQHDVQGGAGQPRLELRTDLARGQVLRTGGERERLRPDEDHDGQEEGHGQGAR